MLEDIRGDEEEENENGEEVEEDQKGSPQPHAVEKDEKSDEEEYVVLWSPTKRVPKKTLAMTL